MKYKTTRVTFDRKKANGGDSERESGFFTWGSHGCSSNLATGRNGQLRRIGEEAGDALWPCVSGASVPEMKSWRQKAGERLQKIEIDAARLVRLADPTSPENILWSV